MCVLCESSGISSNLLTELKCFGTNINERREEREIMERSNKRFPDVQKDNSQMLIIQRNI